MKRTGQAALLSLLITAAWMLPSSAAPPAPAHDAGAKRAENTIQRIRVEEKADSVRVIIDGSTTPSFTVFKLQDPLRVFIDIAGADLAAVREPQRIEDGVIDQIITMQLKDERKAVGRVIVGLDQNAPYRLTTEGNSLVMSITAAPASARAGSGKERQQEIRQLEQEVRSRLAAEEARIEQRRQALEQELGSWEQRKDLARQAAEDQQSRLQEMTEELNRATQKRRLVEKALSEAESERKALQSSKSDDEARRKMAQEAREREEQLLRAAQQARADVEKRRQAAEEALKLYEQQKAHLAGLKSEVTATQGTLSELKAEQVKLQQRRMADEEQLARLRQSLKEAERRRAEAEARARQAEQSREQAERLAEEATQRRKAAETAGAAAAQAAAARQAEQQRHAELVKAVAQAEQQRQAAAAALSREQERIAEIVAARKEEEQRVAKASAAAAEQERRLAAYLEASRKAAAAAEEAEKKIAALRQAEQQEAARARAAGESRREEEARAAAAAELRRQEEARAAAAAEARRQQEALLKATAEANKREAEAAAAHKARLAKSTEKSRQEEARAKAALAAAQARVAALQAAAGQQQEESARLAARVEELRAQEAGLTRALEQKRQAAAGKEAAREKEDGRELARAKEEAQQSSRKAAEAMEQVRRASQELAQLRAQAEAALRKVEETRDELSKARQQAARVETAEAEARSVRADLERVSRALEEARRAASQSQEELARARQDAQQLREQTRQLAEEAASLRQVAAASPSPGEVAALQEEMARLKREQEAATQAAAQARKLNQAASDERQLARDLRRGKGAERAEAAAGGQDDVAARARKAAQAAAAVAAGVAPAPVAEPKPGQPAPVLATVRDIRFEDGSDRCTVVVEHQGQLDFMVQEAGDGSVVMHLDHARLPRVLERTLDTSEMPTPVRSVSSFGGDPSAGDVRVVVTLDHPVESHIRREPGRLLWEFLKAGALPEGGAVMGAGARPAGGPELARGADGVNAVPYSPQRVGGYSAAGAAGYGRQVEAARERFTGKRITIDLRDADIHNVLRLLAKEGRINIIASEEVSGKVTLHLERIPWDQALDVLLKTKGLTQSKEGDIIWITPLSTLREQQKMEMEVKKAKQELDPLEVRLVTVNYAEVDDLTKQASTLLSSRGAATVDKRTKTIIIKDVPDHAEAVEDLARRLDTQTPLVLIEGRIVEADTSYRKDLGIQWGGDVLMSPGSGNPTGLRFPSIVGMSGGADDQQVKPEGLPSNPNFVVNLPAAAGGGSGGALSLTLGSLGGAANLNVRLSALEEQGSLKIISSPKVTTLDNTEASISQGVSIPIAVISAQGINTVFFDANLELRVTPHVTQDGHVLLDILITKNEPDFSRTGARGDPTILRKQTKTSMMIKDGDTTVIGGIFTRQKTHNEKKVPFFGDIPILGALFSFRSDQEKRSELLIFITPRIVNRSEAVVRGGKAGGPATFK